MNSMKVKEKFDAPFGEIPALRLADVPRWGIINMSRRQSVAEHVYNTMLICNWLCESFGIRPSYKHSILMEAMAHDHCEVYSGDIPSPAKENGSNDGCSPVVKLADCIEAYRFANKYCCDSEAVKSWLLKGLKESIIKYIDMIPQVEYIDVFPIMNGD